MIFDLCIVTEVGSGKTFAINPMLVRFIREIDENTVSVTFENDSQIVVAGNVQAMAEQLRKTMR